MPKTLLEVQNEYTTFREQNPDDPTPLQDFARQLDALQGTPGERAAGYDPKWYNKANAAVDRVFHATGLPAVTGAAVGGLGRGFDSLVGTNIEPTVRKIGEDLPRMTAEAVLTIPAVASGAGAPAVAALWGNRLRRVAQAAGYGGTALSGYDQTDSPAGAVIAAGSMGLSNKLLLPANRGGVDVMGRATGALRDRLGIAAPAVDAEAGKVLGATAPQVHFSPDRLKNTLAVGGGIAAEAGTQLGINEATRQAQLTVTPDERRVEGDRNPLTAENIAGNVVGLAPYAVHGALALREGATGFDTRQAKPLMEWIKNQRQATEASAATPTIEEVVKNPYSAKDTNTLRESVRVNLEAARAEEGRGNTEMAQRHRTNAALELARLGEPAYTPESAAQALKEVKVKADTGLAMASPQSFQEFVTEVNRLIGYYNENWVKLQEGEIEESQVNFTKGSPTQSSHPQGSHPEAVARLQKKGLLPEITPEWLLKEGRITEEALQTMDPQFFNGVLAQKVANHLLDNVPEAMRRETAMGLTETPESQEVRFQKERRATQIRDVVNDIAAFPPEVEQRLARVTATILEQKPRPDKHDPTRLSHPFPNWVKDIRKARETYSPIDQTIDLGRGKGREPVAILWGERTPSGGVYAPTWVVDEGREAARLRRSEVGFEDLKSPDMDDSGLFDETEIAQRMTESGGTLINNPKGQAYQASTKASRGTSEDELFASPQVQQALRRVGQEGTPTFAELSQTFSEKVKELSPEAAYNFIRGNVSGKRLDVELDTFWKNHSKDVISALVDLHRREQNTGVAEEASPAGKRLIAVSPWKFKGDEIRQVQKILDVVLRARKDPRALMDTAKTLVEKLTDVKGRKVAEGYKGPVLTAERVEKVKARLAELQDVQRGLDAEFRTLQEAKGGRNEKAFTAFQERQLPVARERVALMTELEDLQRMSGGSLAMSLGGGQDPSAERLVSVALRNPKTGEIVSGKANHALLAENLSWIHEVGDNDEGWITNKGRFLTREESLALAKKNGQFLPGPDEAGFAEVADSGNIVTDPKKLKPMALDSRFPVKDHVVWANGVKSLARENEPVRFLKENGQHAFVTREPAEGIVDYKGQMSKPWRLTYFTQDMVPSGHETFDTWKEAYTAIGMRQGENQSTWKEVRFDPQTKGMTLGDTTLTPEGDLLAPHPRPGAFSDDVLRTIDAVMAKHFGGKGYSGDMRAMYQAAALAIVRSMEGVPLDFYKVSDRSVAGLANENIVPGRGQVGLGVKPIDMETSSHFVHRMLTALTHELAHIDDFVHFGGLRSPDAYSEERARQLANLRSMYNAMDEEQRRAILTTLDEALTPPGYRTAFAENAAQAQRSVSNVDEFSATVMTMVTKSLLFGQSKGLKTALETLDHSPIEIQEYANFQYRAMRDVLQGMQETLADPSVRAAAKKASVATGDPFVLSHAFSAVTAAAMAASRIRDGAKEVSLAREMVKALSEGGSTVPSVETEATWYRRQKAIEENFGRMAKTGPYAMRNAHEAMEMAADTLGVSYDKTKKPGVWARWFYPFAQLMHSMEKSGVDLARPLFNLVNDTESAVHRRYTDIVSPFIKQRTDGTRAWDDEHPLIKNLSPSVRRGVNEVSRWQAENGAKPMFVEQEGQLFPDTAARPEWERIRKSLSLDDQQTVIAASVALDRVGQNMARHTLSVLDEGMTLRVARLLQMLNRQMTYDQAFTQADTITKAYHSGQVSSLVGTIPPATMQAVEALLGGPTGLVKQFNDVKAMLDARPGFRTEQLPHDWIVMYKTPEGETKFTSAPTEKQAYYQADRIRGAGNTLMGEIVNKSDLRSKYQAFDDPDVLLHKFAQVEQNQWEKTVEAIRAGFGNEVAEEVRASYTPGAASLKDRGSQGFQKFLKGSESQVDRGSFDYLDAMLARAARLAASASYKTHGAMKDLILNDPRGRMFPSLGNMVNEHWENMLAPTSDLTKKVKALTTGYFLGGNLSSAAVEGTQSVLTVIPTLIAGNESGGPVKAYGQLAKSIANATEVTTTKEWQTVAKTAEAKLTADPNAKLSKEETRAVLYRRAVADGIIGHGVIQDLVFGADQRTLQLAKFGQGDYGPAPLSEMVTNPLYMGTKLMMALYSPVSKFNDKIAFFAGLNQGLDKGLSGDELYNHARQFKALTTFGGGKANAPGFVGKISNAHTRSAVGMVNTLQQYGYGMVALMAQLGKDSIDAAKSLTPQQRNQARKAFGTMLATQVAVGGVLGVPFAGAALTLIEKLFGVPANQAVREGLASLGSDEDQGGVIAETALNGLGNQMFGLDVSSRVGVSNLLGTSSYRGFNVQDMLGPVPGLLSNMAQGLNWFGQNEPVKAMHSLVPAAFKNVVAMADSHRKYGDLAIRDGGENLLYNPTPAQNIARGFGFRSREESQRRVAETMVSAAEKRTQGVVSREADTAARELLNGNPQAARLYAQDAARQVPGTDARDILRGVMERAVRMTSEKDLLATGSRAGAEERARIVGTFGKGVNERQSEVALARLRTQLAAQLGAPELMPQGKVWQRAAVVDSLVQQRGLARSQALALVEMMGL